MSDPQTVPSNAPHSSPAAGAQPETHPTASAVTAAPASAANANVSAASVPEEYIPGESKLLAAQQGQQAQHAGDDSFSITRPPSAERVREAAAYTLVDEDGRDVSFGSLLPPESPGSATATTTTTTDPKPPPPPRTVVFFIRHFWCGACQDYMLHSVARLDPAVLAAHGITVAIIGCGGWRAIKNYRALSGCAFPVYSDASRGLFALMGMTHQLTLAAPDPSQVQPYNHHTVAGSAWQGIKNGTLRLYKAYPGNWKQLGGEFVFSAGYRCDFAHRMTYGTNHMEAIDVLKYAGLDDAARAKALRDAPVPMGTCALDQNP